MVDDAERLRRLGCGGGGGGLGEDGGGITGGQGIVGCDDGEVFGIWRGGAQPGIELDYSVDLGRQRNVRLDDGPGGLSEQEGMVVGGPVVIDVQGSGQ